MITTWPHIAAPSQKLRKDAPEKRGYFDRMMRPPPCESELHSKNLPLPETHDGHESTRGDPPAHPPGVHRPADAVLVGPRLTPPLPRSAERVGVRGHPAAPRADGPGRLPRRAGQPRRRRRLLPNHLPGPGRAGEHRPQGGHPGWLALRRRAPDGAE